jgi:hypothetical protein
MDSLQQRKQLKLNLGPVADLPSNRSSEEFIARHISESPAGQIRLMESICERSNMRRAIRRVIKNKGAPGVDGMTVRKIKRKLGDVLDYLDVLYFHVGNLGLGSSLLLTLIGFPQEPRADLTPYSIQKGISSSSAVVNGRVSNGPVFYYSPFEYAMYGRNFKPKIFTEYQVSQCLLNYVKNKGA